MKKIPKRDYLILVSLAYLFCAFGFGWTKEPELTVLQMGYCFLISLPLWTPVGKIIDWS